MGFSVFNLAGTILEGVRAAGYSTPTDIQRKAIPEALQGNDIVGCAPTGTGKTAAFVLPILHRLHQTRPSGRSRGRPRALILAPTRELTQQIAESVDVYGSGARCSGVAVYGGVDIGSQIRRLRRGADVVAATPGRLLDHCCRKTIDLSCVEILVLDEADRMYDMGFIRDVRKIIRHVPARRQTLVFSATMPGEIRSLIAEVQREPRMIQIGAPASPPHAVEQRFYSIAQKRKALLLEHILVNEPVSTVLVFSRTKHGADRIVRRLERKGISTTALHSNRSQSQRRRALDGFKRGRYKVLVATDIASRGIDVSGISHVINFDTPSFAEDYVHRVGRTGRCDEKGVAITFVARDERKHLRRIEGLVGKRCGAAEYPGFDSGIEPEVTEAVETTPLYGTRGKAGRPSGPARRNPFERRRFSSGRLSRRLAR